MTASSKVSFPDRGLRAGDSVGRYVVKQTIDQAVGHTSYLVQHTILGFPAVLKVEAAADVLATEWSALTSSDSSHVPVLYSKGELDEGSAKRVYLIEEYVEGTPIAQLLRLRRRFEPKHAVRMVLQMVWALTGVHRQGVVHGDITPDNILLSEQDSSRFVLVNFGGARTNTAPRSGVISKMAVTTGYVAPEVRAGGAPSATADLFALGCILFEVLAGESPQWDNEGRLTRQLCAIVPTHPDLSRVVAKAVASDPRARFETAQDFATVLLALDVDELAAFGTGESTQIQGPAETVDTVDMTQPRADINLAEALRSRATESGGRFPLLSTGKPKIWFFSGDPGLDQPLVEIAIGILLENYEIVVLDAVQRELIHQRVQDTELPWMVVFGDLHALVDEPLLHVLRRQGETVRVLVSTHENVDLLSATINATGLDAQLCLGARPEPLVELVSTMVERVRATRIQYDGLRLAVSDAQSDVERLQQCFERKSA